MIINIVFAKLLPTSDIGVYQSLLFITSSVSFFWISGVIQSLLPLYNNNESFNKSSNSKSPEFFNAFILLFLFSLIVAVLLFSLKSRIGTFIKLKESLDYIKYFSLYILFSSPASLVEYIYLLKNESVKIVKYAIVSFSAQVLFVTIPIVLGFDFIYAIYALLTISVFRFIWLLLLLKKYSEFVISKAFIIEHISSAYPLIFSLLLSGSAQYIDGYLVSSKFGEEVFAVFRYGAIEFPIVVLLATAFSNALVPEFAKTAGISSTLLQIKTKSLKLIHILFPITIVFLLLSKWLYPIVFSHEFINSASVFNIYLLLIISRLIFPQTIFLGLKKTNFILLASLVEIIINVILSVVFINIYGIIGVAYATVIAYLVEKILLSILLKIKIGISFSQYVPIIPLSLYSLILIIVYILVEI